MSHALRVLFSVVLTTGIHAQWSPAWTPRFPNPQPDDRYGFAFSAAPGGGVVLFGGIRGFIVLDETWRWDGDRWMQVPVLSSPSARYDCCSAFDSRRGVVVLFGGTLDGSNFDEVWEFDGRDWSLRTASRTPVARHGATLDFDRASGRCLLFGGRAFSPTGPYDLDDLWAWDGRDWTQIPQPTLRPRARAGHSAAWDSARSRLVVFGGNNLFAGELADTWEYDGTRWTHVASSGPPAAQRTHMVFEPIRNRCVLVGLYAGHMEWDGMVWHAVAPPTPRPDSWQPSWLSALAYDPVSRSIVSFGNQRHSSTWEYGLDPLRARLRSFGVTSCSPVPPFTLVSSDRPVLGAAALPLRFQYAAPHAPGAVLFDLAPRPQAINTRCSLYVPGVGPVLLVSSDGNGRSSVDISIPNLPSLVGWEFYAQLVSTHGPAFDRWALSSGVGIQVGN